MSRSSTDENKAANVPRSEANLVTGPCNGDWQGLCVLVGKACVSLLLGMLALGALVSCSAPKAAFQPVAPECTPELVAAIRLDDVDAVARVFTLHGLPPDVALNINSVTPLMVASAFGSEDVVHWLLMQGASVDAESTYGDYYEFPGEPGSTPLLLAASEGHTYVVEMLLSFGARTEAHSSLGSTPLAAACSEGQLGVVKILVERGADVDHPPEDSPLLAALQQDEIEVAEYLISKGANVNASYSDGRSALMVACETRDVWIVGLLLEKGADPNYADEDGEHALLEAAGLGVTSIVSELLRHGATIDMQDKEGWTPLMKAAVSGFPKTVEVLCQAGADTRRENKFGRTAMAYARGISGTGAITTVGDIRSAAEQGIIDQDEAYYVLMRTGSGRDYDAVVRVLEAYQGGASPSSASGSLQER